MVGGGEYNLAGGGWWVVVDILWVVLGGDRWW